MNADITIGVGINTTQAVQGLRQTGQELRGIAQQAEQASRRMAVPLSQIPGPSRIAVGPRLTPYSGASGLSVADRQWDMMRHQFETAPRAGVPGFNLKTSGDKKTTTADINTLGKAIGITAGGYLANSVIQSYASVASATDGGSWQARRTSQIGGGIISGATTGAMMGSAAGPIGTVVGAGAGAVISGLASWMGVKSLETYEGRQGIYDTIHAVDAQGRAQNTYRDDTAFQLSLESMTRDEQRAALTERVRQARYGDGPESIRKLEARQLELAQNNGTDSLEYRQNAERLASQLQRVDAWERQIFQLDTRPAVSLLETSEVGDSLSRIGGAVGAQIDVSDVNQDQLQELRMIREAILDRNKKAPDEYTTVTTYN